MNLPVAFVTVTESASIFSTTHSPNGAPSRTRAPLRSTRHGYGVVRIPHTGSDGFGATLGADVMDATFHEQCLLSILFLSR